MASIVRPQLFTQLAAPSKRIFSTAAIASSSLRSFTPLTRRPLQSAFVRDALPGASRVALFHATGRRPILPPLPQKIEGTLNDPAAIPPPSPMHGSYHWTFERILSVGLVPLTIAPFTGGSLTPVVDGLLCATILLHSHIGFQSMIIDYLPAKRVPKSRALFMWTLNICTGIVGFAMYQFETNDVGVFELFKRIWVA